MASLAGIIPISLDGGGAPETWARLNESGNITETLYGIPEDNTLPYLEYGSRGDLWREADDGTVALGVEGQQPLYEYNPKTNDLISFRGGQIPADVLAKFPGARARDFMTDPEFEYGRKDDFMGGVFPSLIPALLAAYVTQGASLIGAGSAGGSAGTASGTLADYYAGSASIDAAGGAAMTAGQATGAGSVATALGSGITQGAGGASGITPGTAGVTGVTAATTVNGLPGVTGAAGTAAGTGFGLSELFKTVSDVATVISPIASLIGAASGVSDASKMGSVRTEAPIVAPSIPMPTAASPISFQAQQSFLTSQQRRRGRASTILTQGQGERLGS